MAAFDRASSLSPCARVGVLSPSVRPGVFCQFVLAGSGARGCAEVPEGCWEFAPTTRPGPVKESGLLDEREQMLPMSGCLDGGGGVCGCGFLGLRWD